MDQAKVNELACNCVKCRRECTRLPGWFSPEEATQAIAAGFANRMTAVHQCGPTQVSPGVIVFVDVVALAPSRRGEEGRPSDYGPGRCTFFRGGQCEIHTSGFKPVECVTGFACRPCPPGTPGLVDMANMWNAPAGQEAVALWYATMKSKRG